MILKGLEFRTMLQAGYEALVRAEAEVNEINVFPVADRDTGSNLVRTLGSAMETLPETHHLGRLLTALQMPLLESAQGNAGLIFSAYLIKMGQDLQEQAQVTASRFAEILSRAAEAARNAVAEPKEGTILTTMTAFAEGFAQEVREGGDFPDAWARGLEEAQRALAETREVLPVLREAGVVDAGALGFVTWLQGGFQALKSVGPAVEVQALLQRLADPGEVRTALQRLGTSVVVTSLDTRARVHIHTPFPRTVLRSLARFGILDRYEMTPLLAED